MSRQLSTTFCPRVQGSHQQNPLSRSSSRESPNLSSLVSNPVWKLSLWVQEKGWLTWNSWRMSAVRTTVSENQENQDVTRKNKGTSAKEQDLSSPSFQHGPISPPELAFSVLAFLGYTGGIWGREPVSFFSLETKLTGSPLNFNKISLSGAFSHPWVCYQVPTIQRTWSSQGYGQEKKRTKMTDSQPVEAPG